jgi:REP element-mobilizing transposase RayT
MRLFLKDADFEAFERTIEKTLESRPMRICSYCLMSNHSTWRSGRTTMAI